jgi:hypothetical protein
MAMKRKAAVEILPKVVSLLSDWTRNPQRQVSRITRPMTQHLSRKTRGESLRRFYQTRH